MKKGPALRMISALVSSKETLRARNVLKAVPADAGIWKQYPTPAALLERMVYIVNRYDVTISE